jgi:spore germination protein GerM
MVPFLVMVLVFSVMIWQKYRNSRSVSIAPPAQQQLAGKRTAILFFVAEGAKLVREARELDACGAPVPCLKDLLDELIAGPVGEFDAAIPEGTIVNSVRIDGDSAGIDLNRTFMEGLPSGRSAEMLAVYSIVNTVAVNFPGVKKVLLSIDSDTKNLLRHLDISEPLSADYSLEIQPHSDAVKTPAQLPLSSNKGTP